jgi:hypothetical protein
MEHLKEQAVLNDTPDLVKEAFSLWDELRELSHDHFRLAALETQRAGMSL